MKQEAYAAAASGGDTRGGQSDADVASGMAERQSESFIPYQPSERQPSFSLATGFRVARNNLVLLAVPLIAAVLIGAAIILANVVNGTTQKYEYAFQLTFGDSSELRYPNGEPFNLQDIVAPNVINAVYQDLTVDPERASLADFQTAFSISAYSPSRQFIIDKYRSRLSVRGLTFAETNQLQQELEEELALATRGNAILTFDNSKTGLSDANAKLALEKTVQEWNRYAIDKRGVQKINLSLLEGSFINETSVAGAGRTGELRSIVAVHSKVVENINTLSKLPVGSDLRDPVTGQTFEGLNTRLSFVATRIVQMAKGMLADTSDVSVGISDMISSESFRLVPVENLDAQIAFEVLLERLSDTRNNIASINKVSFGNIVRDPVSNLSANDIANALAEIEVFQIKPLRDISLKRGLSDNPAALRIFYEQRLTDLERRRVSVSAVASAIKKAGFEYQNGASLDGTNNAEGTNRPGGSNAVIPQFDGGFLDRLIKVTGDSKDAEFRQELVRRSLELEETAANLDLKISAVKENLLLLDEGISTVKSSTRKTEQESHRKAIEKILNQLKEQTDITVRIGKRITLANSLTEVLVNQLGLERTDRRILPAAFLSNTTTEFPTAGDVLAELQNIIEIANRIKKEFAVAIYGTNSLFSSLDVPLQAKKSIINVRNFALIALCLALGLLASLFLFYFKLSERKSSGN